MSLTVSVSRMVGGATLKSEGLLVRFPVVTYIFILNFSLASRCSQFGEAYSNEIKHDIIQSNGYIEIDLILKIW